MVKNAFLKIPISLNIDARKMRFFLKEASSKVLQNDTNFLQENVYRFRDIWKKPDFLQKVDF